MHKRWRVRSVWSSASRPEARHWWLRETVFGSVNDRRRGGRQISSKSGGSSRLCAVEMTSQ